MSIITDALRKVEIEKKSEESPKNTITPSSVCCQEPVLDKKQSKTSLYFAGSAILLVISLGFYLTLKINQSSRTKVLQEIQNIENKSEEKNTDILDAHTSYKMPETKYADLQLSGIIYDSIEPMAMINGKFYKENEVLDGIKILKIESDGIVIEYPDQRQESIKLR